MTINNLSKFEVFDKKTGKNINIPRGFTLDYASDIEKIYSLAGRGVYKVVLTEIEIRRK